MLEKNSKISNVNVVLVFVALLFGINPIVVKIGITAISPFIFTTCRLFVAVIAFGIVLYKSKTWIAVEKKDMPYYFKIGLEVFVFQLGMIISLKFVTAAVVATMIGLTPISILIIHTIKGIRKIRRYHYFGAMITFSGVFLISEILGGDMAIDGGQELLGIGILLVAQFAAASYMVTTEKLLKKYSHYQVTTLMFFIGFCLFLAITTPEIVSNGLPKMSGLVVGCIIYGGVVSLCVANVLCLWGIKKIGSHRAGIFNNLPPVFALLAGTVFLDEIPTISQVLGVGLVLVGLYVFKSASIDTTID